MPSATTSAAQSNTGVAQAPASPTVSGSHSASASAASKGAKPSSAPQGSTAAAAPDAGCGSYSKGSEIATGIAQLNARDSDLWSTAKYDDSTWDACKPLSFVHVRAADLVASANQVMLFHKGKYLGTGTLEAYARTGARQVSPTQVQADYHYSLPGESVMGGTGQTTATFTWNEAQQKVVMTGSVPPRY